MLVSDGVVGITDKVIGGFTDNIEMAIKKQGSVFASKIIFTTSAHSMSFIIPFTKLLISVILPLLGLKSFDIPYFFRLLFVLETKGNTNLMMFRPEEQAKIECGKKHFSALENDMEMCVVSDWSTFKGKGV